MPSIRIIVFLVPCHFLLVSFQDANAQIVLNSVDTGFYTPSLHTPVNRRYFTGDDSSGVERRGFFVFEVPESVVGMVASATLELQVGAGRSDINNETIHLYDVTSDIAALTAGTDPGNTFNDLGTGTRFGLANAPIDNSLLGSQAIGVLDIPFNASGLEFVNSTGGLVGFGSRMVSLNSSFQEFLFARFDNSPNDAAQLVLSGAGGPRADYQTSLHPEESQLTVELFLGHPDEGGAQIAAFNNVPVEGTVQATAMLDGTDSGLIQIHGTELKLDSITDFIVGLGPLGEITLDFTDATLDIRTDPIEVLNSVFTLDDTEFVNIALVDGLGVLRDPTEPLASLFDEFPYSADLLLDPVAFGADKIIGQGVGGTTDLGAGLFTDRRELNIDIPPVPFRVIGDDGFEVWARLSGNIHVAVPEPSSITLAVLGGIGLLAIRYRKTAGTSSHSWGGWELL